MDPEIDAERGKEQRGIGEMGFPAQGTWGEKGRVLGKGNRGRTGTGL